MSQLPNFQEVFDATKQIAMGKAPGNDFIPLESMVTKSWLKIVFSFYIRFDHWKSSPRFQGCLYPPSVQIQMSSESV